MRRRYVSDEELTQVIKLKQNGASWLRIENETGIPRRTAKNAYDEWVSTISREELKKARTAVAEEEFRVHMDDLVSLAQALVDSFYIPTPVSRVEDANEAFENLWRKDIRQGRKTVTVEKEEKRVVRQNRMLYQALREHTGEVVRWQALEEWKQAFTDYFEHCGALQKEVWNVIVNILKQRAELKGRIEVMSDGKYILKKMEIGVVEALWRGIRFGDTNIDKIKDNMHIQVRSRGSGIHEISFGKDASFTTINVKEEELGVEIAKFCRVVADNIYIGKKSYLLHNIAADINKMEQCAEELETSLDELVLRPAILRTKCYLCPV